MPLRSFNWGRQLAGEPRTVDSSGGIVEWAVRRAAFVAPRFTQWLDGSTPWGVIYNIPYSSQLCVFGETVLAQPSGGQVAKFEARWVPGVWIGRTSVANEHLVSTERGVIKSRSVQRRPEPYFWLWVMTQATRGSRVTQATRGRRVTQATRG